MNISILTPTIREDGLKILDKALSKTTLDFEWLIGSPFVPDVKTEHKHIKDDYKDGLWSLNRIYNDMIKESSGDIIISIQDYTSFFPHTIKSFIDHYTLNDKAIISGVGNKYFDNIEVWKDPRIKGESFREVPFNEIEGNFCMCPRQALLDVNGFDEQMDFEFLGMDWYDVLSRIKSLGGYKFFIDENIMSYSNVHKRREDWEEKNGIHGKYDAYVSKRGNKLEEDYLCQQNK